VIIDCSDVTSSTGAAAACIGSRKSISMNGIMITGTQSSSSIMNTVQLLSMHSVLSLTNMTFIRLSSYLQSSVIHLNASSTLLMSDTIFMDITCYVAGGATGVILAPGPAIVDISRSIFTDIRVKYDAEIIGIGSAHETSLVNISNCWFDHNQGAIRITSHHPFSFDDDRGARVLITNTQLTNHQVLTEVGGVLRLFTSMTMSWCIFDMISASPTSPASNGKNGGAIFWRPPETFAWIIIDNCRFSRSNFPIRAGGLLLFEVNLPIIQAWINITNSQFNDSFGQASAIRLESGPTCVVTLTMNDCYLKDNYADYGGAMNINGDNGIFLMQRTQFHGNVGTGGGGAIQIGRLGSRIQKLSVS
jgi:hypothetical protein